MGYYINPPAQHSDLTKAEYLKELGAQEVTMEDATEAVKDPTKGVICLVDNGLFDAAAWAYDIREVAAFKHPSDKRPKRWFVLPYDVAKEHAK